ncbi:phospholipase D family protein [Chthonobacter rhizosphaerae]|uniref:phospholipase D family protein n=1 Tax=Chthonobacter rhizosphaerae TaxID=2735553 RepID=UPI0015EED146|nr:phospholipase D family protein [Chthonobacter rhizosphaerae]
MADVTARANQETGNLRAGDRTGARARLADLVRRRARPPGPDPATGALGPRLGAIVAERLAAAGAPNAAALVTDGVQAFASRVMLARTATETLDLQYYSWDKDVTSRLLTLEVLAAADRGVKVRIILDDTSVVGRERAFQLIDRHPNIEVRVFNATTWRSQGLIGFGIEFALGGWHLNHRMHNKAWIADGKAALIGGRNVSDHYFDASGLFNFKDLDVLLLGPPVTEALRVFETFWTSTVVRGVRTFLKPDTRLGAWRFHAFRARIAKVRTDPEAKPYLDALGATYAAPEDLAGSLRFDPVRRAEVIADRPEKARDRTASREVADRLDDVIAKAERELLLISPYFVPGEIGTGLIEDLRARGVRVAVVTNSLAANDVTAVHAGYARYRLRLLKAGVEVHELKRTPGERHRIFGSSGASLHTKAVVVDRRIAFVGSFNLDQRSANLNTEMGVLIDEPRFAERVARQQERLADPRRSYRVTLERGGLVWTADDGGATQVARREPGASVLQRVIARLVGVLPMEAQL